MTHPISTQALAKLAGTSPRNLLLRAKARGVQHVAMLGRNRLWLPEHAALLGRWPASEADEMPKNHKGRFRGP